MFLGICGWPVVAVGALLASLCRPQWPSSVGDGVVVTTRTRPSSSAHTFAWALWLRCSPHCDAEICRGERRCVVGTVADHRHGVALPLRTATLVVGVAPPNASPIPTNVPEGRSVLQGRCLGVRMPNGDYPVAGRPTRENLFKLLTSPGSDWAPSHGRRASRA